MDHAPEQRYELATCVATMFYTLRGIPFIYLEQELGMISPHYDSIEDFDDIESKNLYLEMCKTMSAEEALEKINFGSRDNTRHPMCWDGSEFGGFSTVQPWIKPHSLVHQLNFQADIASEKSVYRFYQKLLALHSREHALTLGDVRFLSKAEDTFMITRRSHGDQQILIVCNFDETQTIALPAPGSCCFPTTLTDRIKQAHTAPSRSPFTESDSKILAQARSLFRACVCFLFHLQESTLAIRPVISYIIHNGLPKQPHPPFL